MKTFTAEGSPRMGITEDLIATYNGFRASNDNTVTVEVATLYKEKGFKNDTVLILTDIVVFAAVGGSVLSVDSGSDTIWSTKVGAGSTVINLKSYLIADKGKDLTVTIAGGGTVAITGRFTSSW